VGFNQAQVVSEYRALRATVIRLWMASSPEIDDSGIDQLTRFNEGVDQALSESTARFMQEIEKSTDLAIAVIAHDLRNPLNSIVTSAQVLQRQMAKRRDRAAISDLGSSIIASGYAHECVDNNLLFNTARRDDILSTSASSHDRGSCR
jgi:signal transduction histidine kinase